MRSVLKLAVFLPVALFSFVTVEAKPEGGICGSYQDHNTSNRIETLHGYDFSGREVPGLNVPHLQILLTNDVEGEVFISASELLVPYPSWGGGTDALINLKGYWMTVTHDDDATQQTNVFFVTEYYYDGQRKL